MTPSLPESEHTPDQRSHMDDELQDAQVELKDGTTLKMRVPAFPNNPELVVYQGDRFAIANSPVIGYGTTLLSYHEAVAYDTASGATPLPPLRPDGYWTRPRGEQSPMRPTIETVDASELRAGDQMVLRVDQVLGPNPETGKIELVGVEAGPLLPEQKVRRVRDAASRA